MFFKEPKDDKNFHWTMHIKRKMQYYGISEGRLKRILRSPERREEGIVEGTVAAMQSTDNKKPTEIWLMYQEDGQKRRMISAWRYPGKSPKGKAVPIPEDIIAELKKEGEIK
jgi:lambda repressor-like predicted transcriptional regulator